MGESISNSGERISPKTTIGITPIAGLTPYVTYAEGYRAPAVTETFIAGFHPGSFFYFEPNPSLKPEVGHNKEVGLNIKYDNVFADNDKFRAKINAFQNDVTNYIDLAQGFIDVTGTLTPPPLCVPTPFSYTDCFQYQNVGSARIYGFELQASYDAGPWFASVSGQHLRGENVTLGAPLATIPPNQISFVLGTRWLDKKLTVAARWTAVAAKPLNQIPTVVSDNGATLPIFDPTHSYNLVNLYTRGGSRVLGRELVERGLSQVYVLQQRVGLRCPKPWHNLQGLRDDPRGNTGGQIARNGKMQSAGD